MVRSMPPNMRSGTSRRVVETQVGPKPGAPPWGVPGDLRNLKRLLGRTALVTGASRGIGAAVALMMAEQGADVAINFRSKGSRAEEIANQVQALGRRALLAQAELTDQSSVEAMAR